MTKLNIDIAAEFTGNKAFKKADTATDKLGRGVKRLGLAMAATFSAQAIVNFGSAAVSAFVSAEKSNARLAKVVDNLGLSFAKANIAGFLDEVSAKSGIAGETLNEAFQPLLTTTGHVLTSQKLLNQALDISAGSGVDLATVTQDLANAYVGNTKGLKKYNLGLTQQQLKTKSFTQLQELLNEQFAGSNAAYLETYAGKMQVINEAAGAAQETIGGGLLDALMAITGDTSIDGLADSMKNFAEETSNALVGLGGLIAKLKGWTEDKGSSWTKGVFGSQFLDWALGVDGVLGGLSKAGERKKNSQLQNPSVQMFLNDQNTKRVEGQKKKDADKLAKVQKDNTKELKRQTAEKKQQGLFDLQQVGLIAALKGKLTDEERDRIKLQLALLQGNESEATKLTEKIAKSIDATGHLATYLRTLPDAKNPFAGWKGYLDAVELQAKRVAEFSAAGTAGGVPKLPDTTGAGAAGKTDVTVNITALGQITTQQDITEAIRNGLLDAGMSGLAVANVRRLGSFGG